MSVLPIASDDMDDLFAKADGQGEGESDPDPPITNSANQPVLEATTLSTIKAAI